MSSVQILRPFYSRRAGFRQCLCSFEGIVSGEPMTTGQMASSHLQCTWLPGGLKVGALGWSSLPGNAGSWGWVVHLELNFFVFQALQICAGEAITMWESKYLFIYLFSFKAAVRASSPLFPGHAAPQHFQRCNGSGDFSQDSCCSLVEVRTVGTTRRTSGLLW